MTYRSPDAYAVLAATYFAAACLVCALVLLTAWAAQAGARSRSDSVRSASAGPRRRRVVALQGQRVGMTAGAGGPRPLTARPGAPRRTAR